MHGRGDIVKEKPATTLFQGQAGTTRLGVVQYRGGELAIIYNGEVMGLRRWSPGTSRHVSKRSSASLAKAATGGSISLH